MNTKKIREYIMIIVGVICVAVGVYFFMMPNSIAAGGINGLAMVINRHIPVLPIGGIMIVIDVILYIVAFYAIGKGFGFKTIFSSLSLSTTIWILEAFVPMNNPLTDDIFMEMIFGIIIQAVGMAIIFIQNASTGGTDIISKILNKYFHTKLGTGVLLADLVVVALAFNTFGFKKGLYALFTVILNGLVIDKVIQSINTLKEVKIISPRSKDVEDYILNNIGRGCTVYLAKGSYSQENINVLCTVVNKKEFSMLKNYIKSLGESSFISTNDVYETLGEGFEEL